MIKAVIDLRFKGPQAPPDLPVAPGAGPLQPGGEAFFQGVLPRPEDEMPHLVWPPKSGTFAERRGKP